MRHIIFVCALICASMVGTTAEAGRGAAVVNYGDEIFDLGPVLPTKTDMRVGRLCQHIGLFWADIWTWDCRIVLADEDLTRYRELPAEMKAEAEALYANVKPARGFWNQYGCFVMLGFVVISILFKAVTKRAGSEPVPAGPAAAPPPMAAQPIAPAPARVAAAAAGGARPVFGRRGVA